MIYNVVLVSDIQQMTHDSNIYIYICSIFSFYRFFSVTGFYKIEIKSDIERVLLVIYFIFSGMYTIL